MQKEIIVCEFCKGEGWTCEDHPKVPWNDGHGCCGGAGMMCECQNKYQHHPKPSDKQADQILAAKKLLPPFPEDATWIKLSEGS